MSVEICCSAVSTLGSASDRDETVDVTADISEDNISVPEPDPEPVCVLPVCWPTMPAREAPVAGFVALDEPVPVEPEPVEPVPVEPVPVGVDGITPAWICSAVFCAA